MHFRFSATFFLSTASGCRAKRSEIWTSGWVFSLYRVLLTVKWLRPVWGHSVHFWFSTTLLSWKRLCIERDSVRMNFGPRGEYSVHTLCFWQLSSWGLGSFGAFPIFDNLVSRKRQVLERNIHLNLYVIQFYLITVRHLVKQLERKSPWASSFEKQNCQKLEIHRSNDLRITLLLDTLN